MGDTIVELNKCVQVQDKLLPTLPMYHTRATRATRREFIDSFGKYTGIKPGILRASYKRLTSDNSACRTANEKDVDECLDLQELKLIYDLRMETKVVLRNSMCFCNSAKSILMDKLILRLTIAGIILYLQEREVPKLLLISQKLLASAG